MLEVEKWLSEQGLILNRDWETLVQPITNAKGARADQNSKVGNQMAIQPLMFFNDLSTAMYVKMKWGGQ